MRLAIIVTEYPKTTETFILRDVMTFIEAGAEVRLFYLAPFRHDEILHDFARPTLQVSRHHPMLGWPALGAAMRNPANAAARGARIMREQMAEPVLMLKSLALLPQASAIAEELRAWRCDHVHAEFAGHPATAAWIIHHLTGIPYSVSCRAHDIFRTQRLLAQKLGGAAFVRTVSNFARDFLLQRVPGMRPEALEVIHSSVDVAAIPLQEPPRVDPFHILYVGSLQSRKGVDVLLEALGGLGLTDWYCTLAGDGPERPALEARAKALGLGNKVRFLGKQGFDRIAELYRKASVVVAPSIIGPRGRTEGIPNVMIEALAFRRPAISTTVSGIPELIRDGHTGRLVAPGSVEDLRQAILDIQADPEGAFRMACAGRDHVEAEFDLKKNALRQLEMFASHTAPAWKAAG
ncbi:MAG: glycosyltransferase family 4 protein [Paracoccaceae bacterium]